jgi:hypothetical protein
MSALTNTYKRRHIMANYNGKDRSFVQYSKINIAKESLPEDAYDKFSIGIFGEEQKEIIITFYTFAGIPSVKLEAVCKSWAFLHECQDILEAIGRVDTGNFTPDDARDLLLGLGIKDITEGLNSISESV